MSEETYKVSSDPEGRDRFLDWLYEQREWMNQTRFLWKQGLLQSNALPFLVYDTGADSLDSSNPYTAFFYVPQGTVLELHLRFWLKKFRAYSKTADAAGSHAHSVTLEDHTHGQTMQLNDLLTGSAGDPAHQHSYLDLGPLAVTSGGGGAVVTSNSVTTHNHPAIYGIYEGTSATGVTVTLNGTDRTAALGGGAGFTTDQTDLDINRAGWLVLPGMNTVKFTSTALGRLEYQVDGYVLGTLKTK